MPRIVGAACNGRVPAGASPATGGSPKHLCSDSRLREQVTVLGESSAVEVPVSPCGSMGLARHRGANNHAGRSIQRTLQHRNLGPAEAEAGGLREPNHSMNGEGHDAGARRVSGNSSCVPSGVRAVARMKGIQTQSREGLALGKVQPISAASVKWLDEGETGGSGRSSDEEQDSITCSERRTRGPWLLMTDGEGLPAINLANSPGAQESQDRVAKVSEAASKRATGRGVVTDRGQGLKPYWGKLAVRNFRGGAGNGPDPRTPRAASSSGLLGPRQLSTQLFVNNPG